MGTTSGVEGGEEGGGIEVVDTAAVEESFREGERESSVGNEDSSVSEKVWTAESRKKLRGLRENKRCS